MTRFFVSGTGTGIGKTWLTRGMARLARRAGRSVVALKPIETGVLGSPEDGLALGRAAGQPELGTLPGLVRRRLAASPYAAVLAGEPAFDLPALADTILRTIAPAEVQLVEGAGGLFVPLDRRTTTAELVRTLGLPVLLAAPNRLGVLSETIATVRAGEQLGLSIPRIVLTPAPPDDSTSTNARILSEYLERPVHLLGRATDDDEVLADTALEAGLGPLVAPAPGDP
jgi:dethiobiotin synthetase